MDALLSHGWLALIFAAWVALAIGSFLNVVIYRLPVMLQRQFIQEAKEALSLLVEPDTSRFNLAVPDSRCPACGHAITALENVPIFSWLFLRGRCSACRTSISVRYPLVEFTTLGLSLIVLAQFSFSPLGYVACLFTWILLAATMIDYDTMLLPDQLTLPLLWLGLTTNLFLGYTPLDAAIIGAIAGYLLLWCTYWGFKLITGKEGMGYGDFKLLAALGAWLGWQMLPAILLIASVSGLVWAIVQIVMKNMRREDPMPFGPYLAVAGWLALVAREPVERFMQF